MTVVIDTTTKLDDRELRDAFGTFPSGVVAVGAQVDGHLVGIAASSFTSISLEPALVSLSVARSSNTWPTLRDAEAVGVSVLADHHDSLCRQLAGPAERRFDGLVIRTSSRGAVLLDDAVTTFTCSLYDELDAGDHVIALLQVLELHAEPERPPLVFHRSGFQRLHRDNLDPAQLDGRINGAQTPTPSADESGENTTGSRA